MSREQRALKKFWSRPEATLSIGCVGCPDRQKCGGQTTADGGFNCLDHCCGLPETCQVVCPNARVFVDRIREVGGLDLETPGAVPIASPPNQPYIPLIFHGSALARDLASSSVAMPLYRFFDSSANCRYSTRVEVSNSFKISCDASLFLSGVAQDNEVERWWKLGASGRIKAISNFRQLNVAMITTPNFSLMVNRPRWDDLHSMRRIAEVYHELVSEGQPAALHVNGRTQQDFQRWTEYICAHPEVTHLAYEFTTGAKNPTRMRQHAHWLGELGRGSGRRLGLILRGGMPVLAPLSLHFAVTLLDSSPFEKAQHREVALIDPHGQRRWTKHPTLPGVPVDDLLAHNLQTSERWFSALLPKLALVA